MTNHERRCERAVLLAIELNLDQILDGSTKGERPLATQKKWCRKCTLSYCNVMYVCSGIAYNGI
jgi:hypothetical protein